MASSLTFFKAGPAVTAGVKLAEKVAEKLPKWLVLPSELKTENAYETRFAKATFAEARSEPATDEGPFTGKQRIKEFGEAFVARMKVNPETVESSNNKKNSSLVTSGLLGVASKGLDVINRALGASDLVSPGLSNMSKLQ